jgi:hypothetical protein
MFIEFFLIFILRPLGRGSALDIAKKNTKI